MHLGHSSDKFFPMGAKSLLRADASSEMYCAPVCESLIAHRGGSEGTLQASCSIVMHEGCSWADLGGCMLHANDETLLIHCTICLDLSLQALRSITYLLLAAIASAQVRVHTRAPCIPGVQRAVTY